MAPRGYWIFPIVSVPTAFQNSQADVENTNIGPFRILKRLGSRRQQAYHARQEAQDRDIALKFISVPPEISWPTVLAKIERETEVLKRLVHENLVRVYGAGVEDENIFFASELIKGESLTSILSRRGKLTPDLAVEYGRQIALALEYLHKHEILHSKLTPDKVLIAKNHLVKVSDVRLNRSRRRRWDSTRRRELDIAAYMAPEQYSEGSTNKSDFYSLGVILFEMLSGHLPYAPDTVSRMTRKKLDSPVPSVATHVMNCPIWLDKIVTQMLQPNPRNRPHSAHAIVLAFDEIKNIDKTGKAAVSQVSGNFNPLNAGVDKTEANRLLGKKEKKKTATEVNFYQGIPFLLGGLVLIAIVLGLAFIPSNPSKTIDKAEAMLATDEWLQSRDLFERVMKNADDPELKKRAEDGYFETRRRSLVRQAEKGTILLSQNRYVKKFAKAIEHQEDGELDESRKTFKWLIANVPADGDNRHIHFEAVSRLEQMGGTPEAEPQLLPTDIEELNSMIAATAGLNEKTQLEDAKKVLAKIVLEFADTEGYSEVVAAADSNLQRVIQHLEEVDAETTRTHVDLEVDPESDDSIEDADQVEENLLDSSDTDVDSESNEEDG